MTNPKSPVWLGTGQAGATIEMRLTEAGRQWAELQAQRIARDEELARPVSQPIKWRKGPPRDSYQAVVVYRNDQNRVVKRLGKRIGDEVVFNLALVCGSDPFNATAPRNADEPRDSVVIGNVDAHIEVPVYSYYGTMNVGRMVGSGYKFI